MKKVFLTIAIVLVSLSSLSAQWDGMILKVNEKHVDLQKYGYKNFSTLATKDYSALKASVYKLNDSYSSDYNALVSREFLVTGVTDLGYGKFFINLFDQSNGDKLFYNYKKEFKSSQFDNVFSVLKYPDGYWCSFIKVKEDKFDTSKNNSSSPLGDDISLHYYTDGTIYLRLTTHQSSIGALGAGLIILFEDGSKLEFPNAKGNNAVPRRGSRIWTQTTMVSITKEQLIKVSNVAITDFRIYIHDNSLKVNEQQAIIGYAKCLLK